jgi:hypothetical protein
MLRLYVAMSLQHIATQLESWRGAVVQESVPILNGARGKLAAVQNEADADAQIGQIETDTRAKLDPILAGGERTLGAMKEACETYFARDEGLATPADQAVRERVDAAAAQVREWASRKLASLVAQARAQELAPPAGSSPSTFPPPPCPRCSSPLSPAMIAARRCYNCQSVL